MTVLTKATLIAVGIVAAAPVFGADLPTKKPAPAPIPEPAIPSNWRFELTAYGWASSLAGNVGIGQLPTLPYYFSFSKVLEHLDGVFMGAATASNGTFIGGVDLVWARVSGSYAFEDPASRLFGVQANPRINEATVTGFGGVRIPIGAPNLIRADSDQAASRLRDHFGTSAKASRTVGIPAIQCVRIPL